VPVRLFFGDADAMAGPEHGRWWQQVIPDAELTIVPGAGHPVVLAAWEQILDAVKQG
jgi:pimeloyl-ACP methyl ester carboxylesterase